MNNEQIFTRERYAKSSSYRSLARWSSYWHQIDFIRTFAPKRVLEVGIGEGVTTSYLRESGIDVVTLDIDASLTPDHVGDVRHIPLQDNVVEVSLAAEILEHMPLADAALALKELARVSSVGAVISAPAPGYVFSWSIKVPLMKKWEGIVKIPFFWKTFVVHTTHGAPHYWELGYKGLSKLKLLALIREAGFTVVRVGVYPDDPSHMFFALKKLDV